jgi:hypothetical protein
LAFSAFSALPAFYLSPLTVYAFGVPTVLPITSHSPRTRHISD